MANDEVLGPRKTMFVLVIVVGCFAVLWPRILSPLILGNSQEQLKPNKFDREAGSQFRVHIFLFPYILGCCEVMFEKEVAVLELINEVCSSAIGVGGKLSPYAAAECRKAVNETCGVDIVEFLKRSDNVGKTTKMLVETMKSTNSSCLKEHFGVQLSSLNVHPALNSWTQQDTLKQERSPIRGMGPHPALRERGRAIPPGAAPQPQQRPPVTLPPHVRVRTSPLSVYYEPEAKPPPIPGMRPPLGSPGGPVPAPKSSMGFVMPIYTICIIVFFVYTLSKILFKRTGSYESVAPDPQFRRRVFRDDSRSTPDKLGPKERDAIVTAISGLVAEVQQQMEASDAQCQQRQDVQDNARPYTNGTILLNSGPVHIIASEFQEPKQNIPEAQKETQKETSPEVPPPQPEVPPPQPEVTNDEKISEPPPQPEVTDDEKISEPVNLQDEQQDKESAETGHDVIDSEKLTTNATDVGNDEEVSVGKVQSDVDLKRDESDNKVDAEDQTDIETAVISPEVDTNDSKDKLDLIALSEGLELDKDEKLAETIEQLIKEERGEAIREEKLSTPELLEEALQEDSLTEQNDDENADKESSSVKVLGMEVTAHPADGGTWPRTQPLATPAPPQPQRPPHEAQDVKSIFLETEIPQQTRVLVADFEENRAERPKPTKHAPLVVSGKMTLSLIQDAPRETPERDPESTVDDFTTASAMTQPNAEKEDDFSEEEIEEEIEIEEIEEEIEEEEEEEEEDEPKKTVVVKK